MAGRRVAPCPRGCTLSQLLELAHTTYIFTGASPLMLAHRTMAVVPQLYNIKGLPVNIFTGASPLMLYSCGTTAIVRWASSKS